MTPLDRAAIEVAKGLQDAPCPDLTWDDVNGWTHEKSYEIARAVLASLREPCLTLCWEAAKMGEQRDSGLVQRQFTHVIDAILNDEDSEK